MMRTSFACLAPARGKNLKTVRDTLASLGSAAAANATVGRPVGSKKNAPATRRPSITAEKPKRSASAKSASKTPDTSKRATSRGRGAASKLKGPSDAKLGGSGMPSKPRVW